MTQNIDYIKKGIKIIKNEVTNLEVKKSDDLFIKIKFYYTLINNYLQLAASYSQFDNHRNALNCGKICLNYFSLLVKEVRKLILSKRNDFDFVFEEFDDIKELLKNKNDLKNDFLNYFDLILKINEEVEDGLNNFKGENDSEISQKVVGNLEKIKIDYKIIPMKIEWVKTISIAYFMHLQYINLKKINHILKFKEIFSETFFSLIVMLTSTIYFMISTENRFNCLEQNSDYSPLNSFKIKMLFEKNHFQRIKKMKRFIFSKNLHYKSIYLLNNYFSENNLLVHLKNSYKKNYETNLELEEIPEEFESRLTNSINGLNEDNLTDYSFSSNYNFRKEDDLKKSLLLFKKDMDNLKIKNNLNYFGDSKKKNDMKFKKKKESKKSSKRHSKKNSIKDEFLKELDILGINNKNINNNIVFIENYNSKNNIFVQKNSELDFKKKKRKFINKNLNRNKKDLRKLISKNLKSKSRDPEMKTNLTFSNKNCMSEKKKLNLSQNRTFYKGIKNREFSNPNLIKKAGENFSNNLFSTQLNNNVKLKKKKKFFQINKKKKIKNSKKSSKRKNDEILIKKAIFPNYQKLSKKHKIKNIRKKNKYKTPIIFDKKILDKKYLKKKKKFKLRPNLNNNDKRILLKNDNHFKFPLSVSRKNKTTNFKNAKKEFFDDLIKNIDFIQNK